SRRHLRSVPPTRAVDDSADDVLRLQAVQRRRRVDTRPLYERWQRVDLEEPRRAVAGDTEVRAGEVAHRAGLEDSSRGGAELCLLLRGEGGGGRGPHGGPPLRVLA